GRAHDDPAARGRAGGERRRIRAARRLRGAGAAQRRRSAGRRRAAPRRGARRVRRHRRGEPRPDRPRPPRAVAHGEARDQRAPARWDPPRVPPDDRAGRPAPRGARAVAVRDGADARGDAPDLARRRPVGAAGSPHGRAHGLPHTRTAARTSRVNLLDVAIVAAIVAAAWAGHRIGFTTRALSWAGLAAGIVFAVAFVDDVTRLFRSSPPRTRLLAALGFFLVVCMIGQTVGFVVGSMLRRRLAFTGTLHAADRFLGGVLGGFGVLVAL